MVNKPAWAQSLKTLKEIFLRQNRARGSWVLGLDQGTGALRYVVWDKKTSQVIQFGRFALEIQDHSGKSGADIPAALREVARAIPKNRLSAVHLNLQGNPLLLGRLEISSGGKHLQSNMLRHALREHLSLPIEDTSMLFREVGTTSDAGQGPAKTIVSYAACHKQATGALVRTIQTLFGFVPDITTQGYAQEALLEALELKEDGGAGAVAIVSGGRSITSISIFKKGKLLFEREIPLAGQDITRSIFITHLQGQTLRSAEDLKVAELLKKQSLIPLAGEGGEPESHENQHLFQSIHGVLTAWVQDIRLSFAYFNEHYDSEIHIEKVVLIGGMANHKNLAEYLSRELGLSVARLVWPAGMDRQRLEGEETLRQWRDNFHEYATAFGLAVKPSFQSSLTPHEYRSADWIEIVDAVLRVFSVVGTALLITGFLFLYLSGAHLKSLKKVVDLHRHFLTKLEGPYQEMVQWEKFFERSDYPVPGAAEFLKMLSRLSPSNVVLLSVSYSREAGSVFLEGLIYGDPKQRAITLADFSDIFKKDPHFKNVEVPLWEPAASGAGKGRFRLVAQYKSQEGAKP